MLEGQAPPDIQVWNILSDSCDYLLPKLVPTFWKLSEVHAKTIEINMLGCDCHILTVRKSTHCKLKRTQQKFIALNNARQLAPSASQRLQRNTTRH
jgi:hypothetical protein